MKRVALTFMFLLLIISPLASFSFPSDVTDPIETGERRVSSAESHSTEIVSFSQNKLLSIDDALYDHQVEPTLAISEDGVLFAGWKNSETHNGGGARVSFSKSTDGGDSWTHPLHMPMFSFQIDFSQSAPGDDIVTRQSDPWLVWFNGSIYYAYLEFSVSGPYFSQITVAKSDDLGSSWNPVRASGGQHFADKETMIVHDDGTVYVVYDDVDTSEGGNVTIRVSISNDGAAVFHDTTTIGNPDEGHVAPYITQSNQGSLFVASTWFTDSGGEILLSKSDDDGATFTEPQFVNNDGHHGWWINADRRPSKITIPVIRFDHNDRLYLLWSDTFNSTERVFDVFLRYSDDYGVTWSNRILVNPIHDGHQWQPEMDIDSEGNLHIVYYDERGEYYRTYYRKASISGEQREIVSLSDPIPIAEQWTSNNFTRPGDYFTVRVDNESIPHVVWTDGRDEKMDIYYAHGILPEPTTTEQPPIATTTTTTATSTEDPNMTGPPAGEFENLLLGVGLGFSIVFVVAVVFLSSVKKR
ncbi:MAG: exo-alpha-sialidase [Candidatus Thorarchaeota archaeon]|nr:MAG: exo-alpha-sialidase [Candidatus Thorarchaeota archaeon]